MPKDVFAAYWKHVRRLCDAEAIARWGLAGLFRPAKDNPFRGNEVAREAAQKEIKTASGNPNLPCEPIRVDSAGELRALLDTLTPMLGTIAQWDDLCESDPSWCARGGRRRYVATGLARIIQDAMLHLAPKGTYAPRLPKQEFTAALAMRLFDVAKLWCDAVSEGMNLPGDLFLAWSLADELLQVVQDVRRFGHDGFMLAMAPGYKWIPAANALRERLADADSSVRPCLQEISKANRGVVQLAYYSELTAFVLVLKLARETLDRALAAAPNAPPFTIEDQKAVMDFMSLLPRISLLEWNDLRAKLKREVVNSADARARQVAKGDDAKTKEKSDKSDTKSDTKKSPRRPRELSAQAAACGAKLKKARKADPTIKKEAFVEEWVAEHGGNASTISRTLSDHPDLWK